MAVKPSRLTAFTGALSAIVVVAFAISHIVYPIGTITTAASGAAVKAGEVAGKGESQLMRIAQRRPAIVFSSAHRLWLIVFQSQPQYDKHNDHNTIDAGLQQHLWNRQLAELDVDVRRV